MNRDDAEEYTATVGMVAAAGWRQIALGERLGVPEALELTTREWVEDRLGGYIRLSLAERRDAARELVAEGMTQRDIADVLGVDHATVNRDLKPIGADAPPLQDDQPDAEEPGADAPPDGRRLEAVYSSGSDDWSTPPDLFAVLDAEFGFELDVCASPTNAKCDRYFTRDDDGLAQHWTGSCWMNPPYGDVIGAWMAKAHEASTNGATVVCLVPARTDTGWWWDHARHGEVRFLRGRLRFGEGAVTAPFPSAVVVLGRDPNVVWWEP